MKSRDRILKCALRQVTLQEEPHVSALTIAPQAEHQPGQSVLSPGKGPLVMALLGHLQRELALLLDPPAAAQLLTGPGQTTETFLPFPVTAQPARYAVIHLEGVQQNGITSDAGLFFVILLRRCY